MNAIRGTLRPWIIVALIGWALFVAVAVIFEGGGVRSILNVAGDCVNDACHVRDRGPWQWIYVVGFVVILAIGFLTRKRT